MENKTDGIVIEARNDMRGSYLVVEACEESSYKEEMLKNSKIQGLLAVMAQDFNGKHELWYETTGLQALTARFKQNPPGTEEIKELMNQIECLALKLEEYLLEPDEMVLQLSCIFESEPCHYVFLYLPGHGKASSGRLYRLLEEMMEYVDYENHRAVSFLYLLHARSRQQACGIFSLHRLCEEILEAARAEEQSRREDDFLAEMSEPKEPEQKKSGWMRREAAEKSDVAAKKRKEGYFYCLLQKLWGHMKGEREAEEESEEEKKELNGDYEGQELGTYYDTVLLPETQMSETVLLTESAETVLLQEQEYCILEPAENGRESILLDTFPFCVGKEETSCNHLFREPVISRRHAKILHEGVQYYLVDTKSLNGTYLNGQRIAAGEKKEIRNGDLIGFADICFIFTCSKASNGI